MIREKTKGRLFFFLLFAVFFLLGGPALAAEEESLSPPSVSLSAKELVYTGEVQYIEPDSLYHPLEAKGHYSFAWYKNGELLSCASRSLPIRYVSDSGSYYCKVIFTYNGKSVEKITDSVQITVAKKEISAPEIPPLIYSGYRQYPAVYSTDAYEVLENQGAVEAGAHSVILRLKDRENTVFAKSAGEVFENGEKLRLSYIVERAQNVFTTPLSVSPTYEGEAPSAHAYARFGTVRYRFFLDAEGTQEISAPTAAGVYYAQAFVEESAGVYALFSPLARFEIRPLSVVALRMLAPPERLSYTAFEPFSPEGISLVATMADGSVRPVDVQSIEIRYAQGGQSLLAKDRQVLLCYADAVLPVAVSVSRAPLDISSAVWSGGGWVYDGEEREITVSGLPPQVRVVSYRENRIRKAGTHTVTAVLSFDSENYEGPSVLTYSVTVEKQPVPVPVLPSAVYSGVPQSPVPQQSPYHFAAQLPTALHAGVYQAVFSLTDAENYCFEGSLGDSVFVSFEILPLSVSVVIDNTVLYLGDRFSLPPYRVVGGQLVGGDDLGLRYRESGGTVEYYFENPDYRVSFEGGSVRRVYRLPAEAESAILLGFLALVFIVLSAFGMILLYKKSAAAAHRVSKSTSACTYPVFSAGAEEVKKQPPPYHLEEKSASEIEFEEPSSVLPLPEAEEPSVDAVDVSTADALITDALAQALVMTEEREIYTEGSRRGVINVDTLSAAFAAGEEVDINRLKKKRLIASDVGYLKVLARGSIDKPLTVYADDFSLGAIKMIALTGGRTFHVKTKPMP